MTLVEINRTLLIRAGIKKDHGPLKCNCYSKGLGRSTKKAPTKWCHVCGWVHLKRSGLNLPPGKSSNSQRTWHFKNTRFAPKNCDLMFHALQKLYTTTNNPSFFDFRQWLRSAASTKRNTGTQVNKFLPSGETYTNFRASKNRFPRLKVQPYCINEIWSGNIVDVHQLAKDKERKKFLSVFLVCLSRFLRIEPIDNMSDKQTRAVMEFRTQN